MQTGAAASAGGLPVMIFSGVFFTNAELPYRNKTTNSCKLNMIPITKMLPAVFVSLKKFSMLQFFT
jgi:hypothetical protein